MLTYVTVKLCSAIISYPGKLVFVVAVALGYSYHCCALRFSFTTCKVF